MRNRPFAYITPTIWSLIVLLFAISCSPSTGKPDWKKTGRYEDARLGFSIEYDEEKLPKYMRPGGQFVFLRQSASQEYPSLAVSVTGLPPGSALKNMAPLVAGSIPMLFPGSKVLGIENQKMIELSDQTEANYFEIKWNTGDFDLRTVCTAAIKDNYLIVVAGTDKIEKPAEVMAAMVKTLKTDIKVDMAALKKIGFGKDGFFERTDSPSFTMNYPKEFRDMPLPANMIFRAGIPQGSPSVEIAILTLDADGDVEKQLIVMADNYAKILGTVGGTEIEILSNEMIDNYGEFSACQFEIVWKWQGRVPLTSVAHIIAKEDKAIQVTGHTVYEPEELLDIFKTINLKP